MSRQHDNLFPPLPPRKLGPPIANNNTAWNPASIIREAIASHGANKQATVTFSAIPQTHSFSGAGVGVGLDASSGPLSLNASLLEHSQVQDPLTMTQLLTEADTGEDAATPLNSTEQSLEGALSEISYAPAERRLSRTDSEAALANFANASINLGTQLGGGCHGSVTAASMSYSDGSSSASFRAVAKTFEESQHGKSLFEHERSMHSVASQGARNRKQYYIITHHGRAVIQGQECLISSEAPNGSLQKYLGPINILCSASGTDQQDGAFQLIYRMAIQALTALKRCFECQLTHRDIKLDNFLVDEAFNIFLADFGVSTKRGVHSPVKNLLKLGNPLGRYDGSPGPENDVFALGHMLLELLGEKIIVGFSGYGQPIFKPNNDEYSNSTGAHFAIPEHIEGYSHPTRIQLAINCLRYQLRHMRSNSNGLHTRYQVLKFAITLMIAPPELRPRAGVLLDCLQAVESSFNSAPGNLQEVVETVIPALLAHYA